MPEAAKRFKVKDLGFGVAFCAGCDGSYMIWFVAWVVSLVWFSSSSWLCLGLPGLLKS